MCFKELVYALVHFIHIHILHKFSLLFSLTEGQTTNCFLIKHSKIYIKIKNEHLNNRKRKWKKAITYTVHTPRLYLYKKS